jgi:hypothetical protein
MVARAHTSTEALTQGKDRETLFLVTWDKSFWGGVSVFGGRRCCMCLGLGGVVSVDGASVHLSSSIYPDGGVFGCAAVVILRVGFSLIVGYLL